MEAPSRTIRIFLASPMRDTGEHRACVAAAVGRVADEVRRHHPGVDVRLLRCDDPHPAFKFPVSATANGQVAVNEYLGTPDRCDLVIAIFRHTMGGQLPQEDFGLHPTLRREWHASEWEVDRAFEGYRRGRVQDILLVRDISPREAAPGETPQQHLEAQAQIQSVEAFFGGLNPRRDRNIKDREILPVNGAADLAANVESWLHRWLAGRAQRLAALTNGAGPDVTTRLSARQETLLAHLTEVADGRDVEAPPLDLVRDVAREPAIGWQAQLLRRYAQWSTQHGGQLDRRFVNLVLMVDRLPRTLQVRDQDLPEGTRFEPADGVSHYNQLATLLNSPEHDDAQAWLLKGDPGCGKSTVLQFHEMMTAARALRTLEGGRPPADLEIAFYVRLSSYRDTDAAPDAWLAEQWNQQRAAGMPDWRDARTSHRIRVLADGLNEIQASSLEEQARAMRRWGIWAAGLTPGSVGLLPPVFSVRTLELGDGLSRHDPRNEQDGGQHPVLKHVSLGIWTDEQIEAYCAKREQPQVWEALKAADNAKVKELCRLPFNLAAQCELFQETHRIVAERGELLSGVVWKRLEAEVRKASRWMALPGLLGPEDLSALRSSGWTQALRALPEQGWLVPALDALAYRMHRRGVSVTFDRQELVEAFEAAVDANTAGRQRPAARAADWLLAIEALDLVGVHSHNARTGQPQLRFSHQLWQEFFAARGLKDLVSGAAGWADASAQTWMPGLGPEELESLDKTLKGLLPGDPLPGPRTSRWEEPVKIAADLLDDPLALLEAVAPVNLPLAARAAALRRVDLESDGRSAAWVADIRQQLLRRSRNVEVDLRLRIEAGLALGDLGDPRYCERAAPGREGVRYRVPAGGYWMRFAAGTYTVGSPKPERNDEGPALSVTLDAFQMAFAPVTNAEFACFVAAGGYEDPRWWQGDMAQAWWRGELRNEAGIKFELDLRAAWRRSPADARRDYRLTEAQAANVEITSALGDGEWTEYLDRWYGARKHREPLYWRDPAFNARAQPVVGVSLFEARAYVAWLRWHSGLPVVLPTEAQWDVAARRGTGRRWPWGDPDPHARQINADPAHLRRTTPVGVFPEGDTPQRQGGESVGLSDLAGNVWEWTTSPYTDRLDQAALTDESAPTDLALRAVRGGSWLSRSGRCRAGVRDRDSPVGRNSSLGFRLVCCPIQNPEP